MEVYAIVGPTGSGKSDLALNLAEKLRRDCEIINADAFALYRGMDIGTAKVLPAEQRGIPHHLIDILEPQQTATIADYQDIGRPLIARLIADGKVPIVVGGSGLYVRALLDELELPGTDAKLRANLNAELNEVGLPEMYRRLEKLDPIAANRIGDKNGRRIIRALEVIQLTGRPFTAELPAPEYLHKTVTIGLDFNRESLDHRIGARVAKMRERGLLAEVECLASPEQGGSGAGLGPTAVRAVGYYELLPVLRGEASEASGFDQIAIHTRQLTRKQMGWFGRDPRIKWFDGASKDLADNVLEYFTQGDAPGPSSAAFSQQGTIRTPLGSISGGV